MTTQITHPYQFAFHDRVSSTAPQITMWERVTAGNLTREEKDSIFHTLQSNSGNSNYRQGGWVFPFGQFMKTYLVKYNYTGDRWREIKAFDKTCIRSSYYTKRDIVEILEKP